MRDKHDDDFFDEDNSQREAADRLVTMVDTHTTRPTVTQKRGSKVSGTVVRIGPEYVFLDIGAKNEAMMKTTELLDAEHNVRVKTGDTVEGFLISDNDGELLVSTSLGTRGEAGVMELVEAMRQRIPVQGKVTGVAKAGLSVKVMGRRAFCPISQVEIAYVEDVNPYLNRTMQFIISRVEEGGRNVVLTRIPLLEQELEKRIDGLASAIESKTPVQGTITRIADFGLFVDLGGFEGLVHISEVSWDRAEKLGELFSVGQPVACLVLGIDHKRTVRETRISLSIKQVQGDPWGTVASAFPVGGTFDGTVTRLMDFGAFVRLAAGVEGLVHVSEMSWSRRVRHPSDVVKPGQSVRVTVLAVDTTKKTISLTLKDAAADPWNDIERRLPKGTIVQGTVASQMNYGYFVDLEEGVTGLLVHANIAADRKDAIKVKGQVEVTIENVDVEKRRISLSCGMVQQVQETREIEEFLSKQQAPAVAAPVSEFGAALRAAMEGRR